MIRLSLLSICLLLFSACQTTEEAANTAAEGAEDAAQATADVANDAANAVSGPVNTAAGAVSDAAGTVWNAATDLFTDDPEADAAALVRPTTAPGSRAEGTVTFTNRGNDLMVNISLRGLAPGVHGFHIHQNPSCAPADTNGDGQPDPAGAAGGHWDPLSTNDHGAPADSRQNKHLGDLGNITASSDGTVQTTMTISNFNPSQNSVTGHAIMSHSGRDDLESDPSGNSGTRMGCGVIEARM